MASSFRALSNLLVRRTPAMDAVGRFSSAACLMDKAGQIVPATSVVSICKVAPLKLPYVAGHLPSLMPPEMAPLEDDDDLFDPLADYPDPAESLSTLVPLQISGFSGAMASPKLLPEARFAALRSLMADAEAEPFLEYASIREASLELTNVAGAKDFESVPPCPTDSLSKLAHWRVGSITVEHEWPNIYSMAMALHCASMRSDQNLSLADDSYFAQGFQRLQCIPMKSDVLLGTFPLLPSNSFSTSGMKLFRGICMVPRLASSLGCKSLPIFGQRMLCTGQGKVDLVNFDEFQKQYQKDRIHLVAGLDNIMLQAEALKADLDLVKVKVYESDIVKKWISKTAKDVLEMSEAQIDRIENIYTVSSYTFGFLAWGTLIFFGAWTIIENEVPVSDYHHLFNSLRVQTVQRAIDHYNIEKKKREKEEKDKADKADALKKALHEALVLKKAKAAEEEALRMSKVQKARAERKTKLDLAEGVRKAKAKEAHAVRFAVWKKERTLRKEAALAMKAKLDQAAAVIKQKQDQAIEGRMSKARKQAAAAAAARKSDAPSSGSKSDGPGGGGGSK